MMDNAIAPGLKATEGEKPTDRDVSLSPSLLKQGRDSALQHGAEWQDPLATKCRISLKF
jgi:hypothetical protein